MLKKLAPEYEQNNGANYTVDSLKDSLAFEDMYNNDRNIPE